MYNVATQCTLWWMFLPVQDVVSNDRHPWTDLYMQFHLDEKCSAELWRTFQTCLPEKQKLFTPTYFNTSTWEVNVLFKKKEEEENRSEDMKWHWLCRAARGPPAGIWLQGCESSGDRFWAWSPACFWTPWCASARWRGSATTTSPLQNIKHSAFTLWGSYSILARQLDRSKNINSQKSSILKNLQR